MVTNDTIGWVIGAAISCLENAPWKTKLLTVFKSAVKLVNVFEKVSLAGKVAERIAGLAGVSAGAVLGADASPTPLESAFVVVGDPFGPRITSFSPTKGKGGTEVTINGERFAPQPADNIVAFGTEKATVVSASPTQLRVLVPPGMGQVKISVKTPNGGPNSSEDSFEIIRSPLITKVRPDFGYSASSNFAGEAYAGTAVEVYGQYLSRPPDPPDKVTFNGVETPIVEVGWDCIKVRVPAGITGTSGGSPGGPTGVVAEVKIVAEDTGTESNPVPFNVVGPPTLNTAAPSEVKGNETMILSGSNFSTVEGEVKVRFEYGGRVLYLTPYPVGGIPSWNGLTVPMPTSIPEDTQGQVKIETPAGVSNGKPFRRTRGLVSGGEVHVYSGSAAVTPDGKISLPEAVLFVTGKLDPHTPPWDDRDETKTYHWYEKKYFDQNNQPHYSFEEGDTTIEYGEGHGGQEIRYIWRAHHYHADNGGGTQSEFLGQEYMEREDSEKEEGDFCDSPGANSADTILTGAGGFLEPMGTLVLDTGYDEIRLGSDTLQGGFELRSNGNKITCATVGGTVSNPGGPGILITGDRNDVSTWAYDSGGAGIEITGGAKGNSIYGESYGNHTGVYIHGQGTEGNEVEAHIGENRENGVVISDGAKFNLVNPGGTKLYIEYNELNGVLITGAGTEGNIVGGYIDANLKNGIHITDGASYNAIRHAVVYQRGENGILIDGNSHYNTIYMSGAEPDREEEMVSTGAGVRIVGEGEVQPFGTNIQYGGMDGGELGLWVSGINRVEPPQGGKSVPPLLVESCGAGDNGKVGILLDNGTQHVIFKSASVHRSPVGVQIKGPDTAWNEFLCRESYPQIWAYQTSVHITDGAHHNTLEGMDVDYDTSREYYLGEEVDENDHIGVLIDDGAHHNSFSGVVEGLEARDVGKEGDGIIIDGANDNTVSGWRHGGETMGCWIGFIQGDGLIIRNGSKNTTVRDLENCCRNLGSGIVVEGADVENTVIGGGVRISENEGTGILINGATSTTIGDLMGSANYLEENGATGNEDGIAGGIRATGGASGVEIVNTCIFNGAQYGIVVDGGSKNVTIGYPSKTLVNAIGGNALDGILISGAGTRWMWAM